MITIDQLLESVDLDFEPRWVTKDDESDIAIWAEKPTFMEGEYIDYWSGGRNVTLEKLKLAEFDGKDWTECIYELPRKTAGKIKEIILTPATTKNTDLFIVNKINELVDAVNKLKSRAENVQSDTESRRANIQPPYVRLYACSDGAVFDNEDMAKSHEASLKSKQSMN